MKERLIELWRFTLRNLYASYFGAFLLALFILTEFISIPYLARYDFIFLAAVAFQVCALLLRFETLKEFSVIVLFHLLATLMELFKTNPSIGSWQYPQTHEAVFILGTVPLFTGFLYSAVGSYISRAFTYLNLRYEHFPKYGHLWALALLIYLNFFTHHYIYDIRWLLFLYAGYIFWKTSVRFQVYKNVRSMPLLVTAFLTASFVWIAENVGTYTKVWLYPSQLAAWHPVSIEKLGSWLLLLFLSFALVSLIYRDRLAYTSKDQ